MKDSSLSLYATLVRAADCTTCTLTVIRDTAVWVQVFQLYLDCWDQVDGRACRRQSAFCAPTQVRKKEGKSHMSVQLTVVVVLSWTIGRGSPDETAKQHSSLLQLYVRTKQLSLPCWMDAASPRSRTYIDRRLSTAPMQRAVSQETLQGG